ncbi:hypothetical protein ACLOJK_036858 [Asimina triloba]
MKCLEKLKVRDCLVLVEVFHFEGIVGEDSSIKPLSRLKEMKLKHLPKLARLRKGVVLPQSLNNLDELRIEKYMSLRCLFSTTLVQNLQKLEALWIGDCNDLQNIISSDDRVPNLSASTNGSPRANLQLPPTIRNLRGMMPSKPMIPTSSMGAKWNYEHDEFFIELMMRQVSRRLKDQWWDEWRNILRELNKRFGVRFQLQELRSHQNWLKKHYFICKSLLSHSGFSWDDVLHKVTADGQAWDEYTKEHPDAKPFRWMSFPYYNKLARLFEGITISIHLFE